MHVQESGKFGVNNKVMKVFLILSLFIGCYHLSANEVFQRVLGGPTGSEAPGKGMLVPVVSVGSIELYEP